MTVPSGLHLLDQPVAADPDAPTVVIVHGAMDRSASFGRVVRQLGDLHVIRFDRRGYGRSSALGPASLMEHVDDLLAVAGERRVTVFGHSIGGIIALAAAVRRPDVVGSVLAYEAPLSWADWWPSARTPPAEDPADEAEAFMRRAIGDHFWGRLPARTRADRRAEGGALRADIASVASAPFDPADVTVPVLVAAGADTCWWHTRAAQELAEALPLGELSVVAGADHGVHLTHPTATAHLVRRAVERGDQERAGRR